MTKHATIYWSLCLLAATALGGNAPLQQNAPLDERVAAIVKSEILAKGVPSVSVAVMRDGKMLLERAWGIADAEKNISASAMTTYPIGSVTKQFTAALLLKQVDRGRLSLSDPIGKHLAGVTPSVGIVTIEQLLNHTSGMKRSIVERNESRFEKISAESLLAKAVEGKLETTPGTTFTYSNAGYTVLGVLVEKLYGTSYAAALHDEIASPLQLTTLSKCAEPKPGEAPGYTLTPARKLDPPPGLHPSQYLGAGGICATAADLVKWTYALHTGRVLSPASYQAMITPRGAAVGSSYGFGLDVSPAQWGHKAIAHGGGSLTGHITEVHWYPEHSVATALQYNVFPRVPGVSDVIPRIVFGVPPPAVGTALASSALSAAAPSDTATPAASAPTALRRASPEPERRRAEQTTLVGVYALGSRMFEIALENGELQLTTPGGSKEPLLFRSGNTYARSGDPSTTLTFIVENGVATAFEVNDGGNRRTLKKVK